MRNEITGKKYTNLKVNSSYGTATNLEGEEIPVVKLSLDVIGLDSGFYNVEIEVTDIEENKERGELGSRLATPMFGLQLKNHQESLHGSLVLLITSQSM
ncbi:MAG TPA: hypothetical protein EYP30_09200 [Archaeoglobaceae archaeon]|nr:hypothetical protein [Archaeoglobaceae archaeon]